MEDFEHIRRLIALKRYETPGDEYFEQFLKDFQKRQRAELLRMPAHRLLLDRFQAWMDGSGKVWMASAAGAAATAMAFLGVLAFQTGHTNEGYLGAQAEPDVPVPVEIVSTSLLQEF